MVYRSVQTLYKCPYCKNEYNIKETAENCAQDCLLINIDEVMEESCKYFQCEICKIMFKDEFDAIQCEKSHSQMEIAKIEYEYNRDKLDEAAWHPEQRKL